MAFYIYQNIPTNKVTIHRGECRFCNEGHGLQQNTLGNKNGQWRIAPDNGYPNYEVARNAAEQLTANMNIQYQNCQRCKPQIENQ